MARTVPAGTVLAHHPSIPISAYGLNNPVKYLDPSGHIACDHSNLPGQDQAACYYDQVYKDGLSPFKYPSQLGTAGAISGNSAAMHVINQTDGFGNVKALNELNGERFANITTTVGGILFEPLDYVFTGHALLTGQVPPDAIPLMIFLMAMPGAQGTWGDNVAEAIIRGGCSFSEDTLVTTADGLIPIGDVEAGTYVLAYNEETGEIGYYPITAVWAHLDPVIVRLTIDGEVILTTPEHPFFTADGEWVAAADLQLGDGIRTAEWTIDTVEEIEFLNRPQVMYNFTVDVAHTYFVGDEQWLVHNSCSLLHSMANELHKANPFGSLGRRTTAVATALDENGNELLLAASSNYYMTRNQQRYLTDLGGMYIKGRGHAEETIIKYAQENGLTVLEVAASRPICDTCAEMIFSAGGRPASPLKNPEKFTGR